MNHRIIIIISSLLALAGCARTPVLLELKGNGEELLFGDATGRLAGKGSFEVGQVQKLSCTGNYNSSSKDRNIEFHFSCSDGRTGQAIINRSGENVANKIGAGELSDGQKVRVFVGDAVHFRAYYRN